jgi:hypothetical protein
MKSTQKQVIESYQRVQVFLTRNPLPAPATYGDAKTMLDDVVAHLTTHSGDQASTIRLGMAETARRRTLRRALRDQHLVPIARIANATLRGSPGIDRATRVPAPQLPTTKLLAEAAAFRDAATPYEDTFVRQGMAADFLARLDAAMEGLRQSQAEHAETKQKRVGAKAGIASEIRRGRQAVQMLDAFVKANFEGNVEVLAKWKSAKKVLRLPGGSNASAEASVQPTAPGTPSAPAAPKAA